MRSRYSAYALARRNDRHGQAMLDYVLATWLPATSPGKLELELYPTQWIGLAILETETGGDAGLVAFRAWFRQNGKADVMAERSRFIRLDGRWFYIDADPQWQGAPA
jgi:SEC-C motif-containing protein